MVATTRTDGDGWVECTCGQRHWGRYGAAGLMLVADDAVLLQHRASWSHEGDTWGVPGGARASTEEPHEAALREAGEEAAVSAADVRLSHTWVVDHGAWSYTTLVAHAETQVTAYAADRESTAVAWVPLSRVDDLPLHPGFAAMWPRLREHARRRLVLVVDAANVVGSRPDGWWHDRVAATQRLRDELAGAAVAGLPAAAVGLPGHRWWPDVELVVEGRATAVGRVGGVSVRRADGHGDAAIAEAARTAVEERPSDSVVVVTADRELRDIVEAAGAATAGPRALLTALPGRTDRR